MRGVVKPAHVVTGAGAVLLAIDVAGVVAFADRGTWNLAILAIVLALVVGSNLLEIQFRGNSLSGEGLALVLAMALLGPAQATVVGLAAGAVWLVTGRRQMRLLGFAQVGTMALGGALVMDAVADAMGALPRDETFSLAVLAGFAVFVVLNVVIQFGANRIYYDEPFWHAVRTTVGPVLPSYAAMVLLASIVVYAEANLGPVALGMIVALFFLYLYLLKELVLSQERAEELAVRGQQLASLQVGVLTAMLRTLSMRDQMTARHSAAVARYARAIAKAAGCSEEEQDLAHTAGLLHDIGKFILPDHILLADSKLDDEDWQLIRMHPYQGARVVREVEGYGPVADIIWCHHERIDGRGYPRGLTGDDIPLISRMISIADTYDVMTSRDSYRNPVSSAEAIEELRRVSGAQLDGDLVEVFIAVLEREDLAFQHTDDTDFETELAFERRVRDYAEPKAVPVPAAA
jgi:putative nucleotidyltransferase with HDIG domain